MNRRDFLRCCAMPSGLWVLGDGAGLTCAAANKGASEWPNHPFLQGNFAPVQEEITADNLKVIATLPPEMDGMFVRNGPNPQFPPLGNYHWFFGDGMLHGVRVQGGKAVRPVIATVMSAPHAGRTVMRSSCSPAVPNSIPR